MLAVKAMLAAKAMVPANPMGASPRLPYSHAGHE
jgi:hypothetical protein